MSNTHIIELAVIPNSTSRVFTRILSVLERCNLGIEAVSTMKVGDDILYVVIAVKSPQEQAELAVRHLKKSTNVVKAKLLTNETSLSQNNRVVYVSHAT